jgi:hypothetical protein
VGAGDQLDGLARCPPRLELTANGGAHHAAVTGHVNSG